MREKSDIHFNGDFNVVQVETSSEFLLETSDESYCVY